MTDPISTQITPVPIDILALPVDLDGCHGSNRASGGKPQIAANRDVDAVRAWLARFVDQAASFASYRKEAERLLLWAVIACSKPLSSLTHEDFLAYRQFLTAPSPAERWVSIDGRKRGRTDPLWRPFNGPLSPASVRQAMVILNVMFSWLVQAGYLAGNPLALSRQRTRQVARHNVRYLEDSLWQDVKDTILAMPMESAAQKAEQARARWLFSLLYLGGLRIAEVANGTMGQFFYRRDAQGVERWWLAVIGKGAKERAIPATKELMAELTRYRQVLGRTVSLQHDAALPLVIPLRGAPAPLTRAALHIVVKKTFNDAAKRVLIRDPNDTGKAALLAQASAHWMRHSAGSHMANSMDVRLVRDNLGHASLTTTSIYLHADDDQRHRETDEHHKINW